ncbi:MAG: ABC transporter ATP-binding protein [Candidatus Moranbacteria bacterium]|nr:ABC transporter ATP-binding protein [Candidatus Moranbacteria bacterium]
MIIQVKNLSKTYEYYKKAPGIWASVAGLFHREKLYKKAVKEISFEIGEGELVGFLGPNGAGKTTTLKMLSGILYPTSGEAKVLGHTPWKREAAYQKQFALVMGQKNQLWWDLPAMESFILNKEIYEVPDAEFEKNLNELVELLDIKDILDVQVRKLSLGQRMKCELVAALLHKPKVLFLDEPTIGLDVVAQKNIRDFVKHYNRENKTTILLTSHYMEDVKDLCKRVIIIEDGEIMYDGDLVKLIEKYAPYKVLKITFERDVEKSDIDRFGEVMEFEPGNVILRVDREKAKNVAREILSSDLPVDDILIDEVDISDVVRKIFSNGKDNSLKA